ncbi:MAG: hypothetical protein WC004_01190 [Candidatus Absconditabacterales bacterium]
MQLIIDHRNNIDPNLIEQAKKESPRDGLRLDFDNPNTNNNYMHFLKSQLLAILEEQGKTLSFASFGQDKYFLPQASKIMGAVPQESVYFMYFFTPQTLRQRGYGNALYKNIIQYLQVDTRYKHMIYNTTNIKNVTMYQNRGAESVLSQHNRHESIYYLRHKL